MLMLTKFILHETDFFLWEGWGGGLQNGKLMISNCNLRILEEEKQCFGVDNVALKYSQCI